jgi:hypothetical protein
MAANPLISSEDSGFEGGTTGHWNATAGALSNGAGGHSGSRELRLTADGSGAATAVLGGGALIPAVFGGRYSFGGWLRSAGGTSRSVSVAFAFLNATGAVLSTTTAPAVTPGAVFQALSNSLVVAPANTTQIRVTATVTGPANGDVIAFDDWTVAQLIPAATAAFPTTGPPGTLVTINGTDLDRVTTVTFGGVVATINAQSSAQLVFTVPGVPAGNYSVALNYINGQTVGSQFQVTLSPPPVPNACNRDAWLDLYGDGTVELSLEDPSKGYFCTELDLGSPAIREVVANKPDMDGVDDRTKYYGSRAISASITALAGAGARIDAVAASFAPYMAASARPRLHYVLDRPGLPERIINLRPANYAWPIIGPYQRDIQLQWVAPDPMSYDAILQSAVAYAGSPGNGRQYNLGFNRVYPSGGSGSSTAQTTPQGDVAVRPVLTLYGPISGATITYQTGTQLGRFFSFLASLIIGAGQWVVIDCAARTVKLNDGTSLMGRVDWATTKAWPVLPPKLTTTWTVYGTNTSGVTQLQIAWQDAYLS